MELTAPKPLFTSLGSSLTYFGRPVKILRAYKLGNVRPDLVAGLTVAVILLPQAIAYAMIAELPPAMGLYSAIVAAIVGALWGSSAQLHTGPTNAASLLVLSTLIPLFAVGSPQYLAAAGMMALMVGVFRLLMGLLKLGVLVNFVSDSVIVGFTAGAGILISFNQLRLLLGLTIPSSPALIETVTALGYNLPDTHIVTLLLGLGTVVVIVLIKRYFPALPAALIAMVGSAVVVAILGLDQIGVQVIGELPRSLPPIAELPLLNVQMISQISTGALAIAAIGLVEAMSIARSISSQTGQRLDSNQEFVGQGLANIACGIFSGYTTSGSFTRSAVNYESGAQTGLSSVFSGIFVLLAMLVFAPFAVYVPRTALAAVLIVTAYGMVDRKEMVRIWNSARGDAAIMTITLLGTLFLPLQFAVLTGIIMSLAYYLMKTSTPRVQTMLPDDDYRHLYHQPGKDQCPQLAVTEILGDLYFGAVNHVEEEILDNMGHHPGQLYLLLRLQNVQHVDISGIHMLESVVRTYRDRGGDVYFTKVRPMVENFMRTTGFFDYVGEDYFLDEDDVISHIFHRVLDPAICIYECEIRAFKECQILPRPTFHLDLPAYRDFDESLITQIPAKYLYANLRSANPPLVIDVREPREFRRGHIPEARNVPLPKLLTRIPDLPRERPLILVCRTGRRSRRAAQALLEQGYDNLQVLDGGMVSWDAAHLLEAVDMIA